MSAVCSLKSLAKQKLYTKEYRKAHPEKVKAWKAAYYQRHKEEHKAKVYAYRAQTPEKWLASNREYQRVRRQRDPLWEKARQLKKDYGLSLSDYEELKRSQDHKCAICRISFTEVRCVVDHDHCTDKVRGLLCDLCNVMLGSARDNVQILQCAVSYLMNIQENQQTG